jgi:hypothetical protein
MPKIDWTDREAVIAAALRFGPGMLVVKHDSRANYNITHAARPDLWDIPGVTVVHRT